MIQETGLKNQTNTEIKTPTNQQSKEKKINPQNLTPPPREGKEVSID